jgi:hypothetical protein
MRLRNFDWADFKAAAAENQKVQQTFKQRACERRGGAIVEDQCVTAQCTYRRYSCDDIKAWKPSHFFAKCEGTWRDCQKK